MQELFPGQVRAPSQAQDGPPIVLAFYPQNTLSAPKSSLCMNLLFPVPFFRLQSESYFCTSRFSSGHADAVQVVQKQLDKKRGKRYANR